ncbi:hypothetical protein HMPREF1152_1406, partial [Mogibacterium sp. CM50]
MRYKSKLFRNYKDIEKYIEVNAMSKEKIKVYLYTRVSTSIQIDGYSLE